MTEGSEEMLNKSFKDMDKQKLLVVYFYVHVDPCHPQFAIHRSDSSPDKVHDAGVVSASLWLRKPVGAF